ncbi:hypothetical protein LWI28_021869 [Acer negundo]|uniref:Phorbol-ester/DAG-type domain-containing protein n=1 Tax=Acer negundo TaxID=4023 RepID=A0AAD5NGY9_ACENE|nr:hypothetical protein LWI28_021869 [Acer negundo]KAK4834834.1 hypothetical protein QYF36_001140 [Acer negundo]
MGYTHPSHPNHKLVLTKSINPYICDGCKETGVGESYRCEECNFDLHKYCMFNKQNTHHDFYGSCTFKFFDHPPRTPSNKCGRYCNSCGKTVKGFVYHCKDKDLDLHPCCRNLPGKLEIDKVEFALRDNELKKKCHWCKKKKLEGSDCGGWSYVSKCEKYRYHVYCITEMMVEELKKGQRKMKVLEEFKNESKNNNNYDDDDTSSGLAVALKNRKLPIEGDRHRRRSGKKKYITIAMKFFKAIACILLGDPGASLICLLVEQLAN